ncbi:phospholipase B-like 1 isoform X2 [Lineus longissimus]|uniref:phospholipase B-like 1 isoform X2 n=1 Tax=Lineus longissimus TaxID=88925 RepID=UPI002B4E63BE
MAKTKMKCCFILLTLPLISLGLVRNMTVYMKNGVWSLTAKEGIIDKKYGMAYGMYDESYMATGWDVLNIKVGYALNGSHTDQELMYAAGYIEGYITAEKINQHWENFYAVFLKDQSVYMANKFKEFYKDQEQWVVDKVVAADGKTPFWRHVSYALAQIDGLYKGHKAAMGKRALTRLQFMQLNSYGDMDAAEKLAPPHDRLDYDKMSPEEFFEDIYGLNLGRCSVLIKPTPGFENLYIGHSTWFIYAAMLRMYKHYDFNLKDPSVANKQVSFSSYPGFITSLDDFYLMGGGLVMVQTTNNVFNTSLFDVVKPQSLLAWQRVLTANRMARDGEEWAKIFAKHNSGTYNAQYMVVDLNKFVPKKAIMDGALWVVEQIPGLVVSGDQTKILRNGHWASYNIAFYEKIYNMSGYPEIVAKFGYGYSHDLASRAKIFRRDNEKVTDMKSFKNIMRYNDYLHDPYSKDNAMQTICSRGDLTTQHAPIGCTDSKVTDFFMAKKLESHAINGPTTSHNLPVFAWKPFPHSVHVGQPKTFNFTWQTMKPKP